MTETHALQVHASDKKQMEGVSSEFHAEKILWARKKSWALLSAIRGALKEGLNEKQAFRLAMEVSKAHGVSKHWHKPFVRFGEGTKLTFRDPLEEKFVLEKDSPFYIDLGPVWRDEGSGLDYEGDVGETFVWGSHPEALRCIQATQQVFEEAKVEYADRSLSGKALYAWMVKRSKSLGYELNEKVQGHRIGDFPHQKYSRENLGSLSFVPSPHLWVLEVHLKHPQLPLGAFFEDILL